MSPAVRVARASLVRYGWADTSLGKLLVATSPRGVVSIDLRGAAEKGSRASLARLEAFARRRVPGGELAADQAAVAEAARQLEEYAAGERRTFELALDLRGTPFERAVWRQLRRLAFGVTATYGELARRLGSPGASRAVGRANGANPVPLVVPCHRVVAAGGALGGFGPGLDLKRRLLALEGVHLPWA